MSSEDFEAAARMPGGARLAEDSRFRGKRHMLVWQVQVRILPNQVPDSRHRDADAMTRLKGLGR
jgi:hypothetical protein